MWRAAIEACVPWLLLLVMGQLMFFVALQMLGAKFRPRRALFLLRDECGSVQSLSFVLTLPFLVLLALFIVQVAQLMAATIVVHYAAFAAARAASVWIPAWLADSGEEENRISFRWVDPTRFDQEFPVLDPSDPQFGPASGGVWYLVEPGSPKYNKIASAAVLACATISPSGRLPIPSSGGTAGISPAVLTAVYESMVPTAIANPRVPDRLINKLQYAAAATEVEIAFYHPNLEPPLIPWFEPPDPNQFYWDELGWQDPIAVTVRFKVPLMPAIGKILARPAALVGGAPDSVSGRIQPWGNIFVYPIAATVMLGNEGDIPARRYPERLW
ncbi:MAG: hypothetical protein NZ899_03855 [Thermoguttaceae bacterium]|nr:hypothetical protein [Thermoguttaceae bacterium]MDW8077732.1 hypothetical protein [Thermoguttaceae bacterium]